MTTTQAPALSRAAQEAAHDDLRALRREVALTALTGVGLIAGVILSLTGAPGWTVALAYGLAYLAGGVPAGIDALKELLKGKLDIDLLMVLAALAAAAVGEARDGAILLFLFSLAGTLEEYAMGRTKRAVEGLMQLRPDTANRRLLSGSGTEEVPIEALEIGDIVVVKPGERIPVDGVVVEGSSAVDQAAITGESIPVDKESDDPVFAATVNGYGALEVRVTKLASETTLARMITLVTEAQASRSPSQRFSDWFGQRYTVFVLVGSAVALGVFFLLGMPSNEAFYKAATLLVVASPCAVVISVPAAILSALAAAARGGVLFKGGGALEDFGNAELVAFDKTGTLTEGKPKVTDLWAEEGDEAALLRLAAAIEARSEHPIAQSILAEAKARGVPLTTPSDVQAVPGYGIAISLDGARYWAGNRKMAESEGVTLSPAFEARVKALEAAGKTPVIVGSSRVLGVIAVADTVRASAKAALQKLREAGITRAVMLTGDHQAAAHNIGRQLGIPDEDIYAELLPEDKVSIVRELRKSAQVAFIGDGVNDAAAITSANVGVAMGAAGSDVAIEAADVALLSDDLNRLESAYKLAQRANRIVRQNLTFSVSVMVILVLFTLFGDLPLPLGVVGHEGGTLVVVFNGLRLLMGRRPASSPAAPAASSATATGD